MKVFLLCLICSLVHIPSIILRYLPFKEEVSIKQKRILVSIYTFALMGNTFYFCFMYYNGIISLEYFKYSLLLLSTVLAFVNGIVIPRRIREHLFTFGLSTIILYILLSIVGYIGFQLPIVKVESLILITSVATSVMFAVFYPIFAKLMRQTITPFLGIQSKEYWKIIWFIPAAMFLASLLSMPMEQHMNTIGSFISRIMVGVATLFICKYISYDYEQLEKREELKSEISRQKEYYFAMTDKVEEARRARHDFKHHIAALKVFSDHKDFDGLTKYINEMTEVDAIQSSVPFTGNFAADGIIYHYLLLCEKEKIQFQEEGMLLGDNVSDLDLCVLLGNALDNALTACREVKGEAFIYLKLVQKDGLLTIMVQNSFDGVIMKQGEKILSKKRKNAEGEGLSSMKNICEKYDGDMKIGYQNHIFSVMLLMNN